MKHLMKMFFCLALIGSLISCGDDDTTPEAADLVGTWSAQFFNADINTSVTVGGENTDIDVEARGSNFNYILTFTETEYTATGSYDIETTVNTGGIEDSQTIPTNATVSGTYTIEGNEIILSESLYDVEADGISTSTFEQEQRATFEINSDNELVFTQDETIEVTGVSSTSIESVSRWVKQ